jgi:hypothetical protein
VDNPAPNGNLWTIWPRQGRLTSRSEYLRDEKAAGGCGPLSWLRRRWCAQPKQWERPWVELTPPCRRPANSTGMAAIDSTGVAATPGLPQSMFHVKLASPAGWSLQAWPARTCASSHSTPRSRGAHLPPPSGPPGRPAPRLQSAAVRGARKPHLAIIDAIDTAAREVPCSLSVASQTMHPVRRSDRFLRGLNGIGNSRQPSSRWC